MQLRKILLGLSFNILIKKLEFEKQRFFFIYKLQKKTEQQNGFFFKSSAKS